MWERFFARFSAVEEQGIRVFMDVLRANAGIADVAALADLHPNDLANALAAIGGDDPFSQADDIQRLALAERMIATAREVVAEQEAPRRRPATPPPAPPATPRKKAAAPPPAPPPAPTAALWRITGRVADAHGDGVPAVAVRAFAKSLRQETLLGETVTNDAGEYDIRYTPPAAGKRAPAAIDVIVRAFEPAAGAALAESAVRFRAKRVEVINLVAGEPAAGTSEFERTMALVTPALDGAALADLDAKDAVFLAGRTRGDRSTINALIMSARAGAATRLEPDAFFLYVRGRQGGKTPAALRPALRAQLGPEQGERVWSIGVAAEILRQDAALLRSFSQWKNDGRLASPLDFAAWDTAAWRTFLDEAWGKANPPAWTAGATREARLSAAAQTLAGAARRAFPKGLVSALLIRGRVADPSSVPAAGFLVQAMDAGAVKPAVLSAPFRTRADGSYELPLDPERMRAARAAAADGALAVTVVVSSRQGEVARSAVQRVGRLPATIDVTIAEFDLLSERLADEGRDPAALDPDGEELRALAERTALDRQALRRFVLAHRRASESSDLPAEAHFALLHPAASLGAGSPAERLRRAEAANLVRPGLAVHAAAVHAWEKRHKASTRTARFSAVGRAGGASTPADLLRAAGIADDVVGRYVEVVAREARPTSESVARRLEEEKLPKDVRFAIDRVEKLTRVVGRDAETVGRLLDEVKRARVRSDDPHGGLSVLAARGARQWATWLAGDGGNAAAPDIQRRARALEAGFERAFPREALQARLQASRSESGRDDRFAGRLEQIEMVIAGSREFELRKRGSRFNFLAPAEAADAMRFGEDPVHRDVEALQRLSRVASFEESITLLEKGYSSAGMIAAASRDRFVRDWAGPAPAAGARETAAAAEARAGRERQAAAIHRRAARHSAAAMSLAAAFSPMYDFVAPKAIGSIWTPADDQAKANLQTLFGSTDACSVPTCQSVLGEPAYFVDLLELLDRGSTSNNALDALLARRPDLAEIELSCENAETELPYIDLVIELLEREVAPPREPRPSGSRLPDNNLGMRVPDVRWETLEFPTHSITAGGVAVAADAPEWSYPQTTWHADDLAAFPEHLNARAYEATAQERRLTLGPRLTLSTALFPWRLPFSLAHAEADVYLDDLGTSRHALKTTFRRRPVAGLTTADRVQFACARLGITPTQHRLVTTARTGDELAKHWGYHRRPNRWPGSEGENVAGLLRRVGLDYANLLEVLLTTYVNPLAGGDRQLRVKPQSAADACDLSQTTITGLNEGALDRMHRFVRTWRAVGWTVRDLGRLIAARPTPAIDDQLLLEIASIREMEARLRLPVEEILTFWCNLDTQASFDRRVTPARRTASQFEAIFQSRSGLSAQDRATLAKARDEATPYTDVSAAACAVLGISADEHACLTDAAAAAALNLPGPMIRATITALPGLSRLVRWRTLAGATGLSIMDLLRMYGVTGIDPFAHPESTVRFLDGLETLRARDVSVDDIDFLLRHVGSENQLRRFEQDALAALQNVRAATFGGTPGRTDLARAVRTVLDRAGAGTPDERAAQVATIMALLEGDGARFTLAETTSRLAPLATASGTSTATLVNRLTATADPASSPGAKRMTAVLDVDAVAAAFVEPALALELASLSQLARKVAKPLAIAAAPAVARTLRTLPTLESIDAVRATELWPAYVRAAKSAWLANRLRLTADELASNGAQHPFTILAPSALPYTRAAAALSPATEDLFRRWTELSALVDVRQRVIAAGASLPAVHAALSAPAAAAAAASWSTLGALAGAAPEEALAIAGNTLLGLADQGPAQAAPPSTWLRFLDALALTRRLGVPASRVAAWCTDDELTLPVSGDIRMAAAGAHTPDEWKERAPRLRDALRERQRDALVAFVGHARGAENLDVLQGQLLIDLEMGPQQRTTRVRLALASVQRFTQRALLGAETDADGEPLALRDDFEGWWSWMRSYRTWRESRKVFLYPENSLEVERRDDKSAFFVELEQALSQRDLTDEAVDDALGDYLSKLDATARMEMMGTCVEDLGDVKILHVLARTRGVPHEFYHRTWHMSDERFTPWAKLDVDIDGDWAIPAVIDGRLHLYWIKHARQIEGMKDAIGLVPSRPFPLSPHYPMYQDQYTLSWSVRQRRGWTARRTVDLPIARPFFPFAPAQFAVRVEDERVRIGGVTLVPPLPILARKQKQHMGRAPGVLGDLQDKGGEGLQKVDEGLGKLEEEFEDSTGVQIPDESPREVFGDAAAELTPDFQAIVNEITHLADRVHGGDLTWSVKKGFEDFFKNLPGWDANSPLPERYRNLLSALDGLIADLISVGEDQVGSIVSRIRALATTLQAIADKAMPLEELPAKAVSGALEGVFQVIGSVITDIKDRLERLPVDLIRGEGLLPENPAVQFDVVQRMLDRLDLNRIGWSGPMLGVEFGFFDVGGAGARALRLSPPPYMANPLDGPMMVFQSGTAALAVAGGAAAMLLYSLFPGYPALFDVPVLDGVLSTDLSLGGHTSGTKAQPDDDLVGAWPGSGYFLVPDGPPPDVTYCSIAVNLKQIATEEAGKFDHERLGEILSAKDEGPLAMFNKMIALTTSTAEITSEAVENAGSLLNIGMRVVRPLPFGGFPQRLYAPAPMIVAEDRRHRSFLLVPDAVRSSRMQSLDGQLRLDPTEKNTPMSTLADSRITWRVIPMYHPLTSALTRAFERGGATEVFRAASRPEGDVWKHRKNAFTESFSVLEGDDKDVDQDVVERLEVTDGGAYTLYNWELFYHLPMLLGAKLTAQQRFERALKWYREVFDPTVARGKAPARYWRFKGFRDPHDEDKAAPVTDVTEWLTALADGEPHDARAKLVATWMTDPFNAHQVARLRPGAYQRAAVMSTVDTLVTWADARFREGTFESINEATQLYLLARDVLGPRPNLVPARPARPMTFAALREAAHDQGRFVDAFGNAVLAIEAALPGAPDETDPDADPAASLVMLSGGSMLYFGVPPNDRLLRCWDTVDDRLSKIRRGLDIRGRVRRGAGADGPNGLDGSLLPAGATIANAEASADTLPLPPYRFPVMLQKAAEFAGDVRAFGGALLSALEKRDAEALGQIRSSHEVRMLQALERVRQLQVEEASHALEALHHNRENAKLRLEYYSSREFLNTAETVKEALGLVASGLQIASGVGELGAAVLHALPNVNLGAAGHSSPHATVQYGASFAANAMSAASRAFAITSTWAQIGSTLAGTIATYERRQEEWDHQASLAESDIAQYDAQIDAAANRLTIARRELDNHRAQVADAQEVQAYLREKFTATELYDWMVGRLSALHFQAYLLAVDMARRAEACYRFERAPEPGRFIKMEQWEGLAVGLLAGERLQLDLRRMEASYLELNTREFELTRHVSLAQLDPVALLTLQERGECYVDIPERLFDEDHPGHYLRRLKSVSLSIPCIAGPYTPINCRVTLVRSEIRATIERPDDYAKGANDHRFLEPQAPVTAIATSSAQNDGGLFELNLHDDRYLPFEGAGAVGLWRIELPRATNRLDFTTIADVVLHMKYTARDGGSKLREAAWRSAFGRAPGAALDPPPARAGLLRMFSARHEYPDAWYRFLSPPAEQTDAVLELDLSAARFPFQPPGRSIVLTEIQVIAAATEDDGASGLVASLARGTVSAGTPAPAAKELKAMDDMAALAEATYAPGAAPNLGPWRLRVAAADNTVPCAAVRVDAAGTLRIDPAVLRDVMVACKYRVD